MAFANASPNADRVVVLGPNSSVSEAVRALADTYVGAILVEDSGKLVGIVTDRDLTLRVLGFARDPEHTLLSDVMTADPATLPLGASEEEVLKAMREHRVRRVPLMDGERIAGVVALDDLIVSMSADRELVRDVVRAQVAELRPSNGGVAAPDARADGAERRAGSAEEALREFESRARDLLGLVTTEQARVAVEVVVANLVQRLAPSAVHVLVARLPVLMKDKFLDLRPGSERRATPATIARELEQELGIDAQRARELLRRICQALELLLGRDSLSQIERALPRDLRALFNIEADSAAEKP
jgi:CBS domain-containing protein/uncharacterized protein (DUF2267 family)